MKNANEILQWIGTTCFMFMYVLMSFFPEMHPWNVVAGTLGGTLYLIWSIRVTNKPQIITNVVGVLVCFAGIIKAWG